MILKFKTNFTEQHRIQGCENKEIGSPLRFPAYWKHQVITLAAVAHHTNTMSTSISLTELLIPTYKQMLNHLSGWLDKAGDKASKLLDHRLAPDMHPLDSQVRFVCHQSKEAVCRLQGKEIPPLQSAELPETVGTVDDAKARIQEALTFLEALEPNALDDLSISERTITLELPGGMTFDMTAAQFARDWALPQFYFHITVAYSILRNAGIELGKADYVPHMFVYLRPGTEPPFRNRDEKAE